MQQKFTVILATYPQFSDFNTNFQFATTSQCFTYIHKEYSIFYFYKISNLLLFWHFVPSFLHLVYFCSRVLVPLRNAGNE